MVCDSWLKFHVENKESPSLGPTWPTWGSPSPRGCRGKNVESLLAAYDVLTEDPEEELQAQKNYEPPDMINWLTM